MSFGAELKDFVKSYQAGYKMADDAQLHAAQVKWYNAQAENQEGPTKAFSAARDKSSGALPLGSAAAPQAGDDISKAADAIASIESGGNANPYGVSVDAGKGRRALGKFQVLDTNVPSWTKEALGREMTPEEFLKSPQAQDAVFRHRFGGYLAKTGSLADAASMWHSGRPLADAQGAVDRLGTRTTDYVTKVLKAYGGAAGAAPNTNPAPSAQPAVAKTTPVTSAVPQPGSQPDYDSNGGNDDDIPHYAEGGVIPYGSADNPAPDSALPLGAGDQASSQAPAPSPQPAGDDHYRSLGDALHGGLQFLQKTFGLSGDQTALPDPSRQDGVKRFMTGEGAASPEEYQAVMKTVDPKGEMPEAIRNIAGINGVYEYYLMRGDKDKADKAAASLMQYTRNIAAKYGAQAVQQVRAGDLPGAVKSVQAGYDATPDGKHLDVQPGPDGAPVATQVDSRTGKPLGQVKVTPQLLVQAAMGLSSGKEYWDRIVQTAADADKTTTSTPSEAFTKAMSAMGQGWTPPSAAGAAGASAPASALPGASSGADAPAASTASSASSDDDDDGAGGTATEGGMAGETSVIPKDGGNATVTPEGNEGSDSAPAPTKTALPIGPKPRDLVPVEQPKPIVPFEKVAGPPPTMPASLLEGLTPAEAARVQAIWKANNTDRYQKAQAEYYRQQKDEQAIQRREAGANVRANTQAESQRFAAETKAASQAHSDQMAKQREEAQARHEMEREKYKTQVQDKKDAALPDIANKDVPGTTTLVEDSLTKDHLKGFPNPETGKPFDDADAATTFLGKGTVRGIRDLGTKIALWNGLPADTAADIATTLVSSDMKGVNKQEPQPPTALYDVKKQDAAGNHVLKIGGRTIKVSEDTLDEIEDMRGKIATKMLLSMNKAPSASTYDKLNKAGNQMGDAFVDGVVKPVAGVVSRATANTRNGTDAGKAANAQGQSIQDALVSALTHQRYKPGAGPRTSALPIPSPRGDN